MKLEDQVCSLEFAKRLKELGVKQVSLFKWASEDSKITFNVWPNSVVLENEYSAFTVAELGDDLPKTLWVKGITLVLKSQPANRLGYWLVFYSHEMWQEENTEADARAKMLIFLLENGLLKL